MLSGVLHAVVEDRPVDHVGGRDVRGGGEVRRTRAGRHHLQRREPVGGRGQRRGDGGDGLQLPRQHLVAINTVGRARARTGLIC